MKILVLSDIHYKEEYSDSEFGVDQFWESLKKKIDEIEISSTNPFELVIITGDLAFSGKSKEYRTLKIALDSYLPSIPIVMIPGNHDVKWSEQVFSLLQKLNDDLSLNNVFRLDGKELIQNSSSDTTIFEGFLEIADELMIKRLELSNKVDYNYNEQAACGYIHYKGEQQDILFLLINSCWKSFGSGSLDFLINQEVEKAYSSKEKVRNLVKRALFDDSLKQLGNQSYYLSQLPWNEIIKIKKESMKPIRVITLAHHPTSWLEYKERFYSTDDKRETLRLDFLKARTDLLITGHEHIPMNSRPTMLSKNCVNLEMGCLLDYHKIQKSNTPSIRFPESWFSVVDIKLSGYSIKNYKFNFTIDENDDDILEWKNEKDQKWEFNFINKQIEQQITSNEELDKLFKDEHYCLLTNSKTIQRIFSLKRKNKFTKILKKEDNGLTELTEGGLFKFEGEIYYLLQNCLGLAFEELRNSNTFNELENSKYFRFIYSFIKLYPEGNLFFVDFLTNSLYNQKTYNERVNHSMIRINAFKHLFFSKFDEIHKFGEIKINYDSFLIAGNTDFD